MRRRGFLTTPFLAFPLSATRGLAARPLVVLELFTSQGCSSCPPADALLGELVGRPGVIGLAWHVDYWNSLGWRDPYARREWTDRQKSYAKYLDGEVYTPALVVNGAAMMVGSDKAAVRRAIAQAAPQSLPTTLRRATSGLEAEIGTTSTPGTGPMTGMLVTYDPRQETQVGAGENDGRKLVEYRVVRDVFSLDVSATRLALPSVDEHCGAVLLIQDASWRVIGAAELLPGQRS